MKVVKSKQKGRRYTISIATEEEATALLHVCGCGVIVEGCMIKEDTNHVRNVLWKELEKAGVRA